MKLEPAKKHKPIGFYICVLGFTFERCAFYTVKYLLAIWIATEVSSGGLGLNDADGAAMSAAFLSWTYITPIFGGYAADHWLKPRVCVAAGMILMGLGYLCTWQAHSLGMVWAMIFLVSVGTGLFKGNLSGINSLLFRDADELDNAFSIQYSFVNIGSFVGTTFVAILATTGLFGLTVSFNTVFLICAVFMFIDASWFIFNGKFLGDAGKEPFKSDRREYIKNEQKKTDADERLDAGDWKKIAAVILVTLFSAVFWMLWYMAYMPAYYYFGWGDGEDFLNHANWYVGDFQIPTSWFDSVNSLACIALGPVIARYWGRRPRKAKRGPNIFRQTAYGIMLVGASYLVMVAADLVRGGGQCSILWLVLVCLLMSLGEMVFSPLGNSFISRISPAKVLGLLLGFWPIAVFIAQQVYPVVYSWLKTLDFAVGYGGIGILVIALGAVLWGFSGALGKLEREDED